MIYKLHKGRRVAPTVEELAQAYSDALRDQFAAGKSVGSPGDARELFKAELALGKREQFAVVFLDNRHRVIAFEVLFSGTIDSTTVHPRVVVQRALELNAAAIILGHNHPSGVAEPSEADQLITRRLRSALDLVDIRLLDHFVIGGDNITSLAARGLL